MQTGRVMIPDEILLAAIGAAIGAIVGSFIVTLVCRWPEVGTVLSGRSRCDSCGTRIAWRSLVPVLSYLSQAGRARCCGAPIDSLHPIGELLAIAIGATSFFLLGWAGWISGLLGWMLLALALFDLRYFVLPDWLTASLALAGLASALAVEPPLPDRLIGAACGYGALQLIRSGYRRMRGRDGLGGGDPKLLGAIGLWVGWQPLAIVMLLASLTGLAIAVLMHLRGEPVTGTKRMPLGALIAAVTWPIWVWSELYPGAWLS